MKPSFIIRTIICLLVATICSCKGDEEAAPYLTVNATSINFSAWAGNKTVEVKSNVAFTAASSQPDWCEVAEQGGAAVKISVSENLLAQERIAEIRVAAKGVQVVTLTVTQSGADIANPDSLPVEYSFITCGQDQVYIIDEKTSSDTGLNILWSWTLLEAMEQLPLAYLTNLRTLDECKPVDNNTKLLLTSSTDGGVLLLERATKKCLFWAYTPQAHSAEWLPGGKIVVALSTHASGNRISVYDINVPEHVLFSDSIYGGHGVVWMPERNRLYALGALKLCEYSLQDWETSAPKLQRERTWNVPTLNGGGHDLSRVNANEFLVSAGSVYSFSLETETFTPFMPDEIVGDIKSISYVEETGWIVYTKTNGVDYWNHYIYMLNPDKVLALPEEYRMYKVRLMENY
jgi:hypothetical protein